MNDLDEIYLLRHTPVYVSKGICYGQLEVPLAESYPNDLERVFSSLQSLGEFTHVFTSPLQRCQQLAHSLVTRWSEMGTKVFCESLDDLKEVSFGSWEGKPWDDIDPKEISPWYADFVMTRPTGGESLHDLSQRVQRAYRHLCQVIAEDCINDHHHTAGRGRPKNRILVISHGGWIRSFMCFFLDIPLASAFKLDIDYGCLAGFVHQSKTPTLKMVLPCLRES
jgi:alpha-ribazole phosphatase